MSAKLIRTRENINIHTNCRVRILSSIKQDYAGTPGSSIRLVLNLGALDLSNRIKQLDQVVIAGGPGKLGQSVNYLQGNRKNSPSVGFTLRT